MSFFPLFLIILLHSLLSESGSVPTATLPVVVTVKVHTVTQIVNTIGSTTIYTTIYGSAADLTRAVATKAVLTTITVTDDSTYLSTAYYTTLYGPDSNTQGDNPGTLSTSTGSKPSRTSQHVPTETTSKPTSSSKSAHGGIPTAAIAIIAVVGVVIGLGLLALAFWFGRIHSRRPAEKENRKRTSAFEIAHDAQSYSRPIFPGGSVSARITRPPDSPTLFPHKAYMEVMGSPVPENNSGARSEFVHEIDAVGAANIRENLRYEKG